MRINRNNSAARPGPQPMPRQQQPTPPQPRQTRQQPAPPQSRRMRQPAPPPQQQHPPQQPQRPPSMPAPPPPPQNLGDLKALLHNFGPLLSAENSGFIKELIAKLEQGGDQQSLQELAARMSAAAQKNK